MKDVGIVMPVYKQDPSYLTLALQSVLNQSYRNFHFVIVSDGAPQETVDVIKKVTKDDKRVHLILKEKNEGVAKTLNVGFDYLMKVEEIKYFTWVSSDNIYYPSFIKKLRKALEKSPENVGLSYSSFRHIDDTGKFLKEPQLEEFYKYQNQPKENLLDVCFIGVSFMYKKRIAAMIEGYRLEPVEDYEYWLRLTEFCDIVYIPEALMEYRTNSPMSVSAQLRNSTAQHRRWRYAFNLARQEARNRRKIPFKLTVLFPIEDGSKNTVDQLERLLEQSFSNYKLLIIDRSQDKAAINVLQHIEDPRVKFIHVPGMTERESLLVGIKEAHTPFTLIYGNGPFPSSQFMLYTFILYCEKLQSSLDKNNLVIYENQNGRVGHRKGTNEIDPAFGHLYRTNELVQILS
jgi:glycosyltransferase involved in cell wall biosynthesis